MCSSCPDARGRGLGAFVLERLQAEARSLGLHYLYNSVRPTHPRSGETARWLERRGFEPREDGTLRRW